MIRRMMEQVVSLELIVSQCLLDLKYYNDVEGVIKASAMAAGMKREEFRSLVEKVRRH